MKSFVLVTKVEGVIIVVGKSSLIDIGFLIDSSLRLLCPSEKANEEFTHF